MFLEEILGGFGVLESCWGLFLVFGMGDLSRISDRKTLKSSKTQTEWFW